MLEMKYNYNIKFKISGALASIPGVFNKRSVISL